MKKLDRRSFLKLSGVLAASGIILPQMPAYANVSGDTLTIAFNTGLPSWDPTVGPSSVNPTIQGIYRSVFDQYIGQSNNLAFKGGLLTDWGWTDEDKTKIKLKVRNDAYWHDGSKVTVDDVIWSLQRAGDPNSGNFIQFIWGKANNYKSKGFNNEITADMEQFEPTFFKWMAFLTGYVLPQAHYSKVGASGFEANPIGSGPYMVDDFQANSFVRLKAFDKYWGGAPHFKTVVYKFITDATVRVAEVESGSSDITTDIPYEEYDRLKQSPKLKGVDTPVSDIAMIFLNDINVMLDKNVRLAAHHAIDKQLIIDRLLRGYGTAIDTLQTPEYDAFDPSIKVGYDPEKAKSLLAASGYSTDNPVSFKIQTTRGYKPKDYQMIQAIVGMWRKVGINAEIEVYEIAKHFELRATDKLAEAAFYNWGNAIGDPTTSTGFAMFGPTPHSVWDSPDLIEKIAPLWGVKDEKQRIDGWREVDRYIAQEGYVIPLLQYTQPIIYRDGLTVTPSKAGSLEAKNVS